MIPIILYLFHIVIIRYITTYKFIKIPFKKFTNTSFNKLDVNEIFKYLENNYIYTEMNIGTPFQKLEVMLNFKDYFTYVIGENATYLEKEIIDVPTYSSSNSKTYKFIEFFNKNPSITKLYYIYDIININDYEFKELKIFEALNFNSYPFDIKNKSGTIGLGVNNYYEKGENNSNFITNLNKKEYINSYNFFVEYNGTNEGNIIIGAQPNEYDPKKYTEKLELYTRFINEGLSKTWGFIIDKISYGDQIITMNYKAAELKLNSGILVFSYEIKNILDKEYFNKLIDDKICQSIQIETFTNNYYCLKDKFDKSLLKPLKITNLDLNYTFTIELKNLFVDIGNYSYFLVKFSNTLGFSSIVLGEPFFKNNIIIFNQDTKMISLYQILKKNQNIKKNNIIIIIIIIVSIIIILLLLYLYRVYKLLPKKKSRFDLSDDYEYIQRDI